MRVLVATTAGAGHLGPLLPFARALVAAGHQVAVAAPGSFAASVERAGFEHQPFADADPEALGRIFATLPSLHPNEANLVVGREIFGRIDGQAALPGMTGIVDDWRPDIVLREMAEFSSCAVAEARDIPYATVAIGLSSFEAMLLTALEEPLHELGMASGVAGLLAKPRLGLVPESFENADGAAMPATARYRDAPAAATPEPLPDWWPGSSDPLVYVTFGSVAAALGLFPALYQAVIGAVADLPVRVLLTTGDGGDVEGLGAVPPNVHAERWWPQQHVMAHASAMVGHGGFGTTLLGLVAGMPMVVMPLFADQPQNARRVAEVGAGIAVEGGPAAAGQLPEAITRVLAEPSFAQAAGRIAADIAALPPVAEAVPFLESLARI